MHTHDPGRVHALRTGRLDERLGLEAQHLPADHPGHGQPTHSTDGDDQCQQVDDERVVLDQVQEQGSLVIGVLRDLHRDMRIESVDDAGHCNRQQHH